MVEKINETLMGNSGRLVGVEFVVIHNDAGSMTPEQYIEWLRYREKSLGIAHYYCNRDAIVRVVDTYNIAYHTGDWWSNIRSIGYEVCESMKVTDEEFLQNEDITLMQATEDLLYYGLSCPHRSLALHGGTTESVKDYFVTRMNEFAQLGSTVEEMLSRMGTEENENISYNEEPTPEEKNPLLEKTNEDIADEVILGLWGNGEERRQRLEEEGYDYDAIQEIVNNKLSEQG